MNEQRIQYDCDTLDYWCSDDDYNGVCKKSFGRFSDDGKSYEIFTKDTPRPWLNYLCNSRIASAVSNTGLGFFWYKTSLLRITKYEHIIDYQPRTFEDGRDVVIEDTATGEVINVFRESQDITCVHRPGRSEVTAKINGYTVKLSVYVPKDDAAECWQIEVTSENAKKVNVYANQVWSVAKFGMHSAKDGIPYLSIPGKDQTVTSITKGLKLHTNNSELPMEMWCAFVSPESVDAKHEILKDIRKDGRVFEFVKATLSFEAELGQNAKTFNIASVAEEDEAAFDALCKKYIVASAFDAEQAKLTEMWDELLKYPSCKIPDKNLENFLNTWLKNQLFLTFRHIRSGLIGYRDTIQDSWGYTLMEPKKAREQILRTISYIKPDGTCPRCYSPFGRDGAHDMRVAMDSATWLGMCIHDYIAETGDYAVLDEKLGYLGDDRVDTVFDHITKAMDRLWEWRGMHGFCLVKDADWNDSIEGISKDGPAVSIWLTMAYYYALKQFADVFAHCGRIDVANEYENRALELKDILNTEGWDGEWFRYAISGAGNYVGSKDNDEGKIHLNANSWAALTGFADKDKMNSALDSIDKYLGSYVGPALIAPPYRKKPSEVGRIVNLEPGTFENGSVYIHAVSFYVISLVRAGRYNEAYEAFWRVLPTNPENFDTRRTSEPYCSGIYYCGPGHKRQGQNFFTWFTGNSAWLLRAGFDEILGVKATLDGLEISPKVPDDWNEFEVKRVYKGTRYNISFKRCGENKIIADGEEIKGNVLGFNDREEVNVTVCFA